MRVREEKVLRFDVTMDDVKCVQRFKSKSYKKKTSNRNHQLMPFILVLHVSIPICLVRWRMEVSERVFFAI